MSAPSSPRVTHPHPPTDRLAGSRTGTARLPRSLLLRWSVEPLGPEDDGSDYAAYRGELAERDEHLAAAAATTDPEEFKFHLEAAAQCEEHASRHAHAANTPDPEMTPAEITSCLLTDLHAAREHGRARRLRGESTPRSVRGRARNREHRPAASRRTASSSSTSGQDPSDPDEPEPPSHGRLCAAPWCNHPVVGPPSKRYCGIERCTRARAEERQRKHRQLRGLSDPERRDLNDARLTHYVGNEAFAAPGEHSLSFRWKHKIVQGDDPGEYDALDQRACRCNGHHIDGGAVGCFKCGLPRKAVAPS